MTFSRKRLARLHDVMEGYVERGEVAGIVALLGRRDEIHVEAIGARDLASGTAIARDTIFRIASMTRRGSSGSTSRSSGFCPSWQTARFCAASKASSTIRCRPTGRSRCATCSPFGWASAR
jgi:hypothetical protein